MAEQKIDVNDYEKIKEEYKTFLIKEKDLEENLDKLREEQEKLKKNLALIVSQTESQITDINKAKKDEGLINEKELQKKCKETVDYFLKDINSNDDSINNINGNNLSIRIEYQNMKIFKSLLDENMTFEKLKDETKLQFGKEANEFYFADEKGNIFLDELKVIPALFPLSKVKIGNYEPIINVVDIIHPKKRKIIDLDEAKIINYNNNEITISFSERVKVFFKLNYLKIFYLIFYLIWLILWIKSRLIFLKADHYRIFKESNDILIKTAHFSNNTNDFMNNLGNSLIQMFGNDSDSSENNNNNHNLNQDNKEKKMYSFMNKFNDNLGYVRLIQKRYKDNDKCSSKRIEYYNNQSCSDKTQYLTDKTADFNGIQYKYVKTSCSSTFKGSLNNYDNDGYVLDLPMKSLKEEIEKHSGFFDYSKTASIILMINIYNRNMNMICTTRILFENLYNKILYFSGNEVFKLKNSTDIYAIFSIFFCIFTLIIITMNCFNNDKTGFDKIKSKLKFKLPKSYECLAILNFILYFIILIYSSTMINSSMRKIPIDTNKFNDYTKYAVRYQIEHDCSSVNILIGFIVLILIFSEDLIEFRVIISTMIRVLKGIWLFILIWIVLFVLVFLFISHYMSGDYSNTIYRENSFIFIKVIQSFFRGSIDNYEFSTDFLNNFQSTLQVFTNSKNQFDRIYNKIGAAGYCLYSLMFYIIVNIFLKGGIIGFCYLIYRDMYIKEKEKKELELRNMIKMKKKNQEMKIKKLQESDKNNNKVVDV